MDIAKILAQHPNVIVTILTTPQNASRFSSIFQRFLQSDLHIHLIQLRFPSKESGLPEGCENLDMLTSLGAASDFFNSSKFLRQEAEKIFEELTPPPSCIISDMCLPYTIHIARNYNIPSISFVGAGCFYLLSIYHLYVSNMMQTMANNPYEYFDLPGFSEKFQINISQTGIGLKDEAWIQFSEDMIKALVGSYGVQRGHNNKNVSDDESIHLKWLDSEKQESVIYACLGSLCNLTSTQLIELGLALEATKRPFIWVIRKGNHLK
ncbi:UDP-glycosyltransferase 73C1-like [Vicia villosa]|uniref:UDP-glycosyltransferase 73C1-like n=1 Tax=Vicia villosa TaxID=3911 RepID=UPI00273B04B7|nr:UDP-glycosyltransferase 73C1-like [Vicia villosa]